MPGNPENIFETFAKAGGLGDDFDFFGGGGSPLGGGSRNSFGGTRGYSTRPNGARKPQPEATIVEKPIAFTLEEYVFPVFFFADDEVWSVVPGRCHGRHEAKPENMPLAEVFG